MADEKSRKETPQDKKEHPHDELPGTTELFDPFQGIGTESPKHRSTDSFDF